MENDNTVLLNPPLFALDKDAPLHYAGNVDGEDEGWGRETGGDHQLSHTPHNQLKHLEKLLRYKTNG